MRRKLLGGVAIVLAMLTISSTAFASGPVVRAPGKGSIADYPRLMADWWTWIAGTSADVNPMFDETGENCAVNQPGGRVFFLASVFDGTVTRTCRVSHKDHLFVPLANAGYIQFPDEGLTLDEIRADIACADESEMTVTLDGVDVPNRYLVESDVFAVDLPEDNLFDDPAYDDVPAMSTGPNLANGYFLLLRPLDRGRHVLRIQATSPNCSDAVLDVTYRLKVV